MYVFLFCLISVECKLVYYILGNVCRVILPILLGQARSLGRFPGQDPPLLCRIFPKPEKPTVIVAKSNDAGKKKSFTNFR